MEWLNEEKKIMQAYIYLKNEIHSTVHNILLHKVSSVYSFKF